MTLEAKNACVLLHGVHFLLSYYLFKQNCSMKVLRYYAQHVSMSKSDLRLLPGNSILSMNFPFLPYFVIDNNSANKGLKQNNLLRGLA
jgi:hypothetical protein